MERTIPAWIILLAVLLPNLTMIAIPPARNQEVISADWIEWIERISRFVAIVGLSFLAVRVTSRTDWLIVAIMGIALIGYWGCWIRYGIAPSREVLFAPLGWIPVPMAIFPLVVLMGSAFLTRNIPVLGATLIFSMSHIRVSIRQ